MTHYDEAINRLGLHVLEDMDYKSVDNCFKMHFVDNEGYQYFLSRQNLTTLGIRNGYASKFFNANPYTKDNIALFIERQFEGDISIVENNAKNAHDKILMYSKRFDCNYFKSWNEIFNGRLYNISHDENWKNPRCHTLEYIKSESLRRFDVTIMSNEYVNNETPIEFVCNKHHNLGVQSMSWGQMISKDRPCKYCSEESSVARRIEKYRDQFNRECRAHKHPDIVVLGEYIDAHQKIKCICTKCGEEFYLRPDHIVRGIGCGRCTKSLGERLVEEFLTANGIKYTSQFIFTDCKMTKKAMPFDFYLHDYNIAIEFDGIQHYQPLDQFGGEEEFAKLRKRDAYKTEYCAKRGIGLIRISYEQINNIPSCLREQLKISV